MRPNVFELLNKINELLRASSVAGLSKLEFDLLKQNIQQLYEQVLTEREIKEQPHEILELEADEIVKAPVKETPSKKEVIIQTNEVTTEKNYAPIKNDEATPKKDYPTLVNEKTSEVKTEKISAKPSINEVSTGKESLNEKLKKSSKEMHKTFASKPLKDQIDLNKRFVLVNELFSGSPSAFSSAVEKIDSFNSFEAAESLIKKELALAHNWDFNTQTVRMFVKLVKQKFGEHE